MLDTLISSKTRIKLLQKFFLNSNIKAYLRGLESEFGESTNAIRLELNKFEKAGLISSENIGNKKIFQANIKHPLFSDLQSIVHKYMGIDKIIEHVIVKLGDIKKVYLLGDYAKGRDNGIIDLLFIASEIDESYLIKVISKAEGLIQRKIRYVRFDKEKEADKHINENESLLIWNGN